MSVVVVRAKVECDRCGRIEPTTPIADPEAAPWTLAAQRVVYVAMRRDIVSPELRARAVAGGTRHFQLEGEAAARFYGSLAEQAWQRTDACAVRLLAPRTGVGFNDQRR